MFKRIYYRKLNVEGSECANFGWAYPAGRRNPGDDGSSIGGDGCQVVEQQEREGPSGDEDHDGAAVLRVGAEEHAGAEPGKGLKAGLRRL